MPLAVLGVLILWVGWYGFNPGSTMAAITQIADIALTTTLAAAAGVLGAMAMSYVYRATSTSGWAATAPSRRSSPSPPPAPSSRPGPP